MERSTLEEESFMQVVAESTFTFFYNHAPVRVAEGDTVRSDAAVYLLRTSSAVRPADGEAEEFAASLREHADVPEADGSESSTEGAEVDPNDVPDGTIEVILEWVGDDADRARRAREAETAEGGKNRPRLIARLDAIID